MYKNSFIPIAALLVFTLAFTACKKDAALTLGEVPSKIEGISATWKLVKVEQYDEKVLNSDYARFDITEFFITGPNIPSIAFTANGNYTYTAGDAANYFGTGGTWKFDDDLYPTLITAVSNGESLNWTLEGPTRSVDNYLKIRIPRGCLGYTGYQYAFTFQRQ